MDNRFFMAVTSCDGENFHGMEIPKGAIYGVDKNGIYICTDYRIKGISKTQRPALAVYRYNSQFDCWYKKIEANTTTEMIIDYYFEHEAECEIDENFALDPQRPREHQYHIEMLAIAKDFKTEHDGYKLPKGAMYGIDEKGAFICLNYRLQTRSRNGRGSGYINGYPCLTIMRPQKNTSVYSNPFYEKQSDHYYWSRSVEHNNTTLAIMNMYETHIDECEIIYARDLHQVAKQIDLRLGYEEPVHYTTLHGRSNMHPNSAKGNTWCIISRQTTLEDMAQRQKGKIKL